MIRIKGIYGSTAVDVTISLEHSEAELEAFKRDAKDAPVIMGVVLDTIVPMIEVIADKFPAITEAVFKLAEDKLPWYIKWQKDLAKRANALAKKLFRN